MWRSIVNTAFFLALLSTVIAFTRCTTIEPIKDQVVADNTRTDALIDTLKDTEITPQGRLIDDNTWNWLQSELEQCKADRINTANQIVSLHMQIRNKEVEFLKCTAQVNEYAKEAGAGELVYFFLYIIIGAFVVTVVFLVYLIFKNLSLKRLITGG